MIVLFFLELLLLFILSRMLTSELSRLIHKVFRSEKLTVFLMALIFFPGTVIHEFSHAIMAKLLFVHVGKMSLMPEISGENLKLGSVEVGRADVVRNLLIGIAPFIVGTGLILTVLHYAISNALLGFNLITVAILLFVFMISNTMHSSKKDLEGAVGFVLLIVIPFVILYFVGVRIPYLSWAIINNNTYSDYFRLGSILLVIPIIIDLVAIMFAKLLIRK